MKTLLAIYDFSIYKMSLNELLLSATNSNDLSLNQIQGCQDIGIR